VRPEKGPLCLLCHTWPATDSSTAVAGQSVRWSMLDSADQYTPCTMRTDWVLFITPVGCVLCWTLLLEIGQAPGHEAPVRHGYLADIRAAGSV